MFWRTSANDCFYSHWELDRKKILKKITHTAWKVSVSVFWSVFYRIRNKYGEISSISPYSVPLLVQSECGKIRTRKTSNTELFAQCQVYTGSYGQTHTVKVVINEKEQLRQIILKTPVIPKMDWKSVLKMEIVLKTFWFHELQCD